VIKLEEKIFYATEKHIYKDITLVILSIFFWSLPLRIFTALSIFNALTEFILDYTLFFTVISTILCLFFLKRLYSSFFHPLIRLNTYYFIYNFDNNVYPWKLIKKIEIIGSTIRFSVKNEPIFSKDKSQSIKYVKEKEKLITEIIKFSKKYDIPLEYTKS
jgi:hypothetical protein